MSSLKDELKALMAKREEMEKEMEESLTLLKGTPAGVSEPLIDREGFPRADCDLYMVRRERGKVACLKNDLKDIMQQIQDKLQDIHKEAKETGTVSSGIAVDMLLQRYAKSPPILTVSSVLPDSPAAESSLLPEDEILSWGGITKEDGEIMKKIAALTKDHEDKTIDVIILRRHEPHHLYLTPHKWSGAGLLGCVLHPIKK
eukprot:TRINITY_DN2369_c0_g1_i1.p1 TRINITY_DN2369_c0_g1~~TRINITY_DN2369_c0_g1_i1.p1  ORF type:complete len:232 (+),score=40.97 TRINITY_DN2369_c0_g1_i1:95-697(+)